MKLYKYRTPEQISILEKKMVRYSPTQVFNDPFELRPSYAGIRNPGVIRENLLRSFRDAASITVKDYVSNSYTEQAAAIELVTARFEKEILADDAKLAREFIADLPDINTRLDATIGIFSMSAIHDNPLLWGHYSDGHRGFAVEFDSNCDLLQSRGKSSGVEFGIPIEVGYSTMRPRSVLDDIQPRELYLTKQVDWRYEHEYRSLRLLAEADEFDKRDKYDLPVCLFRFSGSAATAVYVGCKANEELIRRLERIRESDHEFNFEIRQLGIDVSSYSLNVINTM